jgi:hypothetical protein
MDRSTGGGSERRDERRQRAAGPPPFAALAAHAGVCGDGLRPAPGAFALLSEIRLPPTRAARTTRSRGIFLPPTAASKQPRGGRKPGLSIVTVAVAVAAFALALVVGAPGAIRWSSGSLNPGPAMVGATSVPPSFVDTGGAR